MQHLEQTIDSREVAEMIGKEHRQLLKDIRRYIQHFNEGKIAPVEFFQENIYKDNKGETRPCYLITKKGCEFIAHKMTGVKGTIFTARYINRFHDMEDVIQSKNTDETDKGVLPTSKPSLPKNLDIDKARRNWFGYMLTALETQIGLTKDNMLHQSYESMKNEGTDPSIVKARYMEATGRTDCSTFEAICNDKCAALELAEILCRNMEIVLIKRPL